MQLCGGILKRLHYNLLNCYIKKRTKSQCAALSATSHTAEKHQATRKEANKRQRVESVWVKIFA